MRFVIGSEVMEQDFVRMKFESAFSEVLFIGEAHCRFGVVLKPWW